MKKLIAITTIVISLIALAMTHQEKERLSQIDISKVNASNVSNVIDACIAVTNGWKISKICDANILTCKQILDMIENASYLIDTYASVSLKSKDPALQSAGYAKLKQYVLSSSDSVFNAALAFNLYKFSDFTQSEIEAVANQLIQDGKTLSAIRIVYHPQQTNKALKASNLSMLFDKWLLTPNVIDTRYDAIDHLNGILIINYVIRNNQVEMLNRALPKAKALAAVGGLCYGDALMTGQYFDEVRTAFIKSDTKPSRKKYLAKRIDTFMKNSTYTALLYPYLVSSNDKVEAAVRMNDADKLIDIFKVADDTIAASAIEQAIVILNGVNAGYRTDDLKLALMNINKKYTLKLYSDRDTWEPILSKIRAMIETL